MAAAPQPSQPPSWPISWIGRLHRAFVFGRRARVLSETLAGWIAPSASVLDIGCGDGTIGNLIAKLRPDVCVKGVEYLLRPGCKIECHSFDGSTLPFADASFDVCLFVDVLHHTQNPSVLLGEAARVSRAWVLLKDHLDENFIDDVTLRLMDWVGNRPHGVALSYNYQSRKQWEEHFSRHGLAITQWTMDVPIYPLPFSLVVGRGLHFVSLLKKTK
jgi:SAM-dependent methyltransferase